MKRIFRLAGLHIVVISSIVTVAIFWVKTMIRDSNVMWVGFLFVFLFTIVTSLLGLVFYLNYRDKKQTNYLFSHDQLTHLPNKYGACQYVDEKISHKEAFYMLMINIDSFKEINERFGYQYGDSLLIEYSGMLLSIVEKSMLFARMDGDGFLLVAPSLGEQDCMFMIKHIMNLTKEFESSKEELYEFSASVSSISYPKYGQNYHELISLLEHTMKFQRKVLGQGHDMGFTMDIYDGYLREQQLVKEVKAGIDHKEFDVFIQPQVDLANNKAIGGEALVRWNHPEKGLLGPAMFLEIVEKHGLMRMMDYYVFEKVCYLLKEWQDIYEPFKVSVNVTGTTFEDDELIYKLTDIIKKTGVDPTWIVIEVTEDVGLEDLERANALIHAINNLGMKVALDDFGTGYSSLAYVEQLNINLIKIDKTFIDYIHVKPESYEIYKLMLELSSIKGVPIVVEGVEVEEQINKINIRKGIIAQGYYYSKPLCVSDYESYMDNQGMVRSPAAASL